jgi:Chaperone of endosialidase
MNDLLRCHAVRIALVFALVIAPIYGQQPLNPPLKNWAAPLYWAPSPAEAQQQRLEQHIAHPDASSPAQAVSIFTPPGPMTFIAMTPCRVMDTRSTQPFTGPFGPPSLAADVTRVVPMPISSCNIPSNAGAYSLNITAAPPGPLSFLSVWPAGQPYPGVSTLNDPISGGVIANAAIIVAGTSGAIQMLASNPTDVIIDINGYYASPTDLNSNTAIGTGTLGSNTTGSDNTASGAGALGANTTGSNNTASGASALGANTTGDLNTASGASALQNNTTGYQDTADGALALEYNTTGFANMASGTAALEYNTTGSDNTANGSGTMIENTTGSLNTAVGFGALVSNTTGSGNTAVGAEALDSNSIGSNNVAVGQSALPHIMGSNNIGIGFQAGLNITGSSSNNIDIGSQGSVGDGAPGESGVIRIGTPETQRSTYIAGIFGGTPGTSNLLVCVDGLGTLGTTGCSSTPSSLRFKEQITDMGDSSSKLLQLRPVTFLYKPQYDDGSHSLQYGLIAEEVAKLYPDMVGYDKDGQPSSVKYQSLAPMLLNEVQKQNAQIRSLEERLAALEGLLSNRQ